MSEEIVDIGQRVRHIRQEKRIKQVDLAKSIGVTPSYLNRLERNSRTDTGRNMSLKKVIAIQQALGVSMDDLLYGKKG